MAGKKIDDITKIGVIDAHKEGLSRKEIAEKFSISPTSVSRIIKSHTAQKDQKSETVNGKKSDRQKRIEAVEKKILQLEKKIDELIAKRK
jgi:predicted transcriptional regulator